MKKLIALTVFICVVLTGCSFSFFDEPTTEYKSIYATDVNGDFVPVHEDVDESILDPMLFAYDEE